MPCALIFLPVQLTVFHVTDQNGNKITDENVLKYIEQVFDGLYKF